jgi:carboxypeptidase C (cathepsin A)
VRGGEGRDGVASFRANHIGNPAMRSIILFLIPAVLIHGVRRTPNDARASSRGRRLEFVVNHEDQLATPPQPTSRRAAATPNNDNANNPNPDEHLVTSMPLLPDGLFPTRHWAGHLPASNDGSDKKLFYWLFEPGGDDLANISTEEEIPLILWLNGGPGCSSMDGLWLENGPFRLKKSDGDSSNWTIDVNKHSWHMAPAWTLYVDQPVG